MIFSTLCAIVPIVLFGNSAGEHLSLGLSSLVLTGLIAAQSSSLSVVCVAGQCVQGYSNTTLGATLNAPNAPSSLHLLPGTYTTASNPQLLHTVLTSSGASLTPFPGFENASQTFKSSNLPLELDMSPGLTVFGDIRYSGQGTYSGFSDTPPSPSNNDGGDQPTQISASSFALSSNVYAVVGGLGSGGDQVVFWDSVPDVTQLPFSSSSGPGSSSSSAALLNLFDISSTTCSSACSSNGICSPTNNTCICAPGFTGTSCETCASGFFGPKCQACPSDCDQCDEGIQGTGRCLNKTITGRPESCGCVNGQCGSNGQCTCNAGWADGTDGTKCSKCQPGFYLTSAGDCRVCQTGCLQCADVTGSCTQCSPGLSPNAGDNTSCVPKPPSTGQKCADGSFNNGTSCSLCSTSCKSCTGPTSNDCIQCNGAYIFNGTCVGNNADGSCESTTGMIANNVNGKCDACPSKCTSCKIPGFTPASTVDQVQCTGCLPGSVLSQGKCVDSCPAGTFLSPQDNLNCIPCDSSCGTCADSATFCLTCSTPSQLAFGGKCVSSCPSNTFTSNSSCTTCHGDCASCSGPQFSQCTSCPPTRPVLSNGRCLSTCAKGEYFDKSSGKCRSCDGSCATCSSSGAANCLSCPDGEVLRQGKCVQSDGGCETLQGLGVCLTDLVVKPQANSTTGSGAPIPSITGISDPTKSTTKVENKLAWWQILLMALGGVFCGFIVIVLWRRHARKKRLQRTRNWATERGVLGGKGGTWWRRMFSRKQRNGYNTRTEKEKGLPRYRDDVISEHPESTVDGFIDAYADERLSWEYRSSVASRSLFSEITGERRKAPEPRVPVREQSMSVKSLRTTRSIARSRKTSGEKKSVEVETEAEKYARSVREKPATSQVGEHPGAAPFLATEPFWVQSTSTGSNGDSKSRNPFRR
ncbi:hypothetical protein P691DRAFT_855337 [Macrolepiota fuliginosa MF-IS2]|uniref:EGF-like domain-containing protein n=1 Tax=Macrolepiota fuliginosa MF-IS2 TaxID=1400762 RepID=A0A9P6C6J2_9AGAR|nr:hypothetical protein P691DRAFT_855337 [Macrolepiota fuliginosa MF-IS2]